MIKMCSLSQRNAATADDGGTAPGSLDVKQVHAALAAAEDELARAVVRGSIHLLLTSRGL